MGALAILQLALRGVCAEPALAGDARYVIGAVTPNNQLVCSKRSTLE